MSFAWIGLRILQDSCTRDSLSIGIIALILRTLAIIARLWSWRRGSWRKWRVNPRALPALYFRLGGPVFYMTDNLARRFVFETTASPRSLISCRSETVRALEPRRSKDNISHTGRQYNRHATFRPATRARVYVISCTCTPSRLRACTWRCVFYTVYMNVTPVLLYILYASTFDVRACSREKIGDRVEVCGTLRPRQSSSRRPLSHRAETRPLRSERDAEWRAEHVENGIVRANRFRDGFAIPRHGRFPVFPLLRISAETQWERQKLGMYGGCK